MILIFHLLHTACSTLFFKGFYCLTFQLEYSSKKWMEPVFNHLNESRIKSIVENKSKTATWIVSHCKTESKRDILVKQIKKLIDVTTYGECGIPS